MKALMILAYKNFRDEEYTETRKILEKNAISIATASWATGTATGKFGTETKIDFSLKNIDINNYNCIIYIGGSGCKKYWNDLTAHQIAQGTLARNKVLCAICSAPIILARAGLLKGKNATCYSGDIPEMEKEGAKYTGRPVEQDGLIITADGPASVKRFSKRIVQTLKKGGK